MHPLLYTALSAAEAAAEIHLRHFGAVGLEGAREKGPSDYVSQVDMEAQKAAVKVILSRHPDHRILAEEDMDGEESTDPRQADSRMWPPNGSPLWIIDPLDGTANYLHGHPFFCASVAVGRQKPTGEAGGAGILEAGAVVAPRTGERWWARRGDGAWKNGRPISVSGAVSLRQALVGTGFPFKKPDLVPRYVQQLGRVLRASGGVRRTGSAAMDLCYLAEGILDAFWEEEYLSPWDVAAGLVILREAGGVAARLDGRDIDLADGSILGASCTGVAGELAALLRDEAGPR